MISKSDEKITQRPEVCFMGALVAEWAVFFQRTFRRHEQ
jgi:hypothetical protein